MNTKQIAFFNFGRLFASCLTCLFITAHCAGDEAQNSLSAEVKEILRSRCADCHGSAASSTDFDVLDAQSLIDAGVVAAAKPEESKLMKVLVSEDEEIRMPQDLPALSSSEIDKIRNWIVAGATAFPKDVPLPKEENREDSFSSIAGVDYVLKRILAHQRSLSSDQAKSMRYFSCNHLLTRGATRDELNLQRDALAKTVNHLTYARDPVMIEAVDGETATVFAVDIRKLGWHHESLKAVGSHGKLEPSLNNYDLLLLEYPYAISYEDSDTFEKLKAEFMIPGRMVRPIAYMRIDWFCSVATQPPLYHDMMHMPSRVLDLEREIIGVNAETELSHKNVARGAVILSGVSRNNRAAERYASPHGAYWKSIDYATNKGDENIFRDPINLHGVGGEMIFNLPNGLHGYYLATATGDRLDAGPTEIVTDKFAEDKLVRNALSCMRCHDQGIKAFKDSVRPAIESMPGNLGFSRSEVLKLYPKQDELSGYFKSDGGRFMSSLEKVLGHPQKVEPLAPVTRRFLEDPITLTTAAGELGLMKTGDLGAVFRSRQFAALGLIPLAGQGAVRRDTWEDYFEQIVRELGLGVGIICLDANTRHDFAPLGHGPNIQITTTKNSRTFSSGDQIAAIITNQGKSEVYIELIGTGTKGEKVILVPAGQKLSPGASVRFPKEGTIKVKPSLGHELITVFASEAEFPAGTLYQGKNIADRYVHELDLQRVSPIVKKSLIIETR
jgi:serine/threonine-protein kinase